MSLRRDNRGSFQLGCFFPNGKTGAVFSDHLLDVNPEPNAESLVQLARSCEAVGLDWVLIADGWVGMDRLSESLQHASPMLHAPTLGAVLASATEDIGVITTMHTDIHKPAHVARIGASLDAISDGRWGWNIVTDQPNQAALFGQEPLDHDKRYEVADEFTEVVKALWASADPVDIQGEHFSTKGRLKAPHIVQRPHPLLVNAAASPAGMRFAARHCDMLLTSAPTVEHAAEVRATMDELLVEAGREPHELDVVVTGKCLVRPTEAEAQDEWQRIVDRLNLDVGLDQMATMYSGDAAMPAREANREQLEAARRVAMGAWFNDMVGSAQTVADRITALRDVGITGIAMQFLRWSDDDVRQFGAVVDILRSTGVRTHDAGR
jgi:FMNH2-dependent dimethyl sulfone monooxygenase